MPRDSFIKVIKNATCKPNESTHFKWRIMLLFEFYGGPHKKKKMLMKQHREATTFF